MQGLVLCITLEHKRCLPLFHFFFLLGESFNAKSDSKLIFFLFRSMPLRLVPSLWPTIASWNAHNAFLPYKENFFFFVYFMVGFLMYAVFALFSSFTTLTL